MIELTEHEQWCKDQGIGWDALDFLQWAESAGLNGPYVCGLRSQYLKTGNVDWVIKDAHQVNDHWVARNCSDI